MHNQIQNKIITPFFISNRLKIIKPKIKTIFLFYLHKLALNYQKFTICINVYVQLPIYARAIECLS